MVNYVITPVPQPALSTASAWDVTGGSEPYVVRCCDRGEWTCSCPHFRWRLGNRARDGHHCKHVNAVRCFIGDHKFMTAPNADGGQECVRCRVSIAEFEFKEYGPADAPLEPCRLDY